MDKLVILYTMKSCPYCHTLKEMLDKENLIYVDRDINEHSKEYDLFCEITGNDFVPAFMTINSYNDNPTTKLFAPERDFNEIEEGLEIIKKFYKE